jgi:hypothetical protein
VDFSTGVLLIRLPLPYKISKASVPGSIRSSLVHTAMVRLPEIFEKIGTFAYVNHVSKLDTLADNTVDNKVIV